MHFALQLVSDHPLDHRCAEALMRRLFDDRAAPFGPAQDEAFVRRACPRYADPSAGYRQRPVLCCIGDQFVQRDTNRLSRIRCEPHRRPINLDAPFGPSGIGRKLLAGDAGKRSAGPVRVDKQIVKFGECLDAPLDGAFKTLGRIGTRKIYGSLDRRQDILGSMLGLPGERSDMFVVALSVRDVPGRSCRERL